MGYKKNEAEQIKKVFVPMLEKMEEIEKEYNEVVELQPNEENCKKAKELRLQLVKIRTGTAKIHKEAKQYYLNGGRFVDGFKNTVVFALQDKEKNLEDIEKYFENLEKERIQKLQEERIKLISEYVEDTEHLEYMQEDVWNAYYSAKKKEYKDKIKAEQERLQKEREEAERLQKNQKYKEFLKKNEGNYDKIIKENEKIVLYKIVDTFNI